MCYYLVQLFSYFGQFECRLLTRLMNGSIISKYVLVPPVVVLPVLLVGKP